MCVCVKVRDNGSWSLFSNLIWLEITSVSFVWISSSLFHTLLAIHLVISNYFLNLFSSCCFPFSLSHSLFHRKHLQCVITLFFAIGSVRLVFIPSILNVLIMCLISSFVQWMFYVMKGFVSFSFESVSIIIFFRSNSLLFYDSAFICLQFMSSEKENVRMGSGVWCSCSTVIVIIAVIVIKIFQPKSTK